jgi:ammonia channel protein AmtB
MFSIGVCAVARPWEALVIGGIGGALALVCVHILDRLKIDDPVGASSVHGACGIWVRNVQIL